MHSRSTNVLRGIGETERRMITALSAAEVPVVSADDIVSSLGISRTAANLGLARLAKKGWLQRLRRGRYSLVPLSSRSAAPAVEDPLAVAMQLFSPCYVSGWTSAQHWDLTDQIHNAVVVLSARPQRHGTLMVGRVAYRVRRIRPEAIFGTVRVWSGTVAVQMASSHRTVIDVLDSPEIGGGGRQTVDIVRAYWSSRTAEPKTLLDLAVRLGRGTVFKRLGLLAEQSGRVEHRWLEEYRGHLSKGVSLLDPASPIQGPIVSRWRLRVNIPIEDWA